MGLDVVQPVNPSTTKWMPPSGAGRDKARYYWTRVDISYYVTALLLLMGRCLCFKGYIRDCGSKDLATIIAINAQRLDTVDLKKSRFTNFDCVDQCANCILSCPLYRPPTPSHRPSVQTPRRNRRHSSANHSFDDVSFVLESDASTKKTSYQLHLFVD